MSHSKHFDFVAADSIDQAEGEARKRIAASESTIPWPAFRIVGHRIDSMTQLIAEPVSRC
jgi:hypothetical protein